MSREVIEDCDDMSELQVLKAENSAFVEECIAELSSAFDTSHDLESCQHLTVKLQYLTKLADAILEKEEALEL
jgi:hypothetical protein